jgi:hypothetical protein
MGMHMVMTDDWGEPGEVALDPWADELVAIGEPDEFDVWLGIAGEDAHPGGRGAVVVYRGDYRLGVFRNDAFYRKILTEPCHSNTILMTVAVRSRAPSGGWRLGVRLPLVPGFIRRLPMVS